MCAVLASLAFGTKSSKIEGAELILLDVLQRTMRTEWAEPAFIVWTGRPFGLGIDVEVQAFVSVHTCECSRVVGALGHPPQIVLMQKFAGLAFLAKAPKPMLANKVVVRRRHMMLVRAVVSKRTVALHVCFT